MLRYLFRPSPYIGKEGVGCAQARARWLRKTGVDGTFGPTACAFTRHVTCTLRCALAPTQPCAQPYHAYVTISCRSDDDPLVPCGRCGQDGGVILQLDVTARSSFKRLVNMESMRFSIGMLIRNAKLIIEQTGRTSLKRQQRKHTTSGYATLPH